MIKTERFYQGFTGLYSTVVKVEMPLISVEYKADDHTLRDLWKFYF